MKLIKNCITSMLLLAMSITLVGCKSNSDESHDELDKAAQIEQSDLLATTVESDEPKNQPGDHSVSKTAMSTDADCAALTQSQCLKSASCILDQSKKRAYFCRAAKDNCELGFVQAGEKLKRSCLSKGKCYYQGASCFCPQGKVCICGGGRPAMCSTHSMDHSPLY